MFGIRHASERNSGNVLIRSYTFTNAFLQILSLHFQVFQHLFVFIISTFLHLRMLAVTKRDGRDNNTTDHSPILIAKCCKTTAALTPTLLQNIRNTIKCAELRHFCWQKKCFMQGLSPTTCIFKRGCSMSKCPIYFARVGWTSRAHPG